MAPWSKEANQYLSAHRRILKDLGEDALGSFEHQLLATKRASLELQMWESPANMASLPGLRLLAFQVWPPSRPFKILHAWWQTPSLAADLMKLFRPQAQVMLIGHTHYPGCGAGPGASSPTLAVSLTTWPRKLRSLKAKFWRCVG